MSTKLKNFQKPKLWYAICSSSLAMTWLMTASVVQASDLQIYATPTAGKKTIIMMLDTSGSMGPTISTQSSNGKYSFGIPADYGITSCNTTSVNSTTTPVYPRNFCYVVASSATATATVKATDGSGCKPVDARGNEYTYPVPTNVSIKGYRCFDRLTRLKDGMFAFLDNSDNKKFNVVSVGLGHFSTYTNTAWTNGDDNSGEILVPAADLGAVGSAQRIALKTAVAKLSADGGTPTANAFAEAAAYLMGTNTVSNGLVKVDDYKFVSSNYYQCKSLASPDFTNMVQQCNGRTGTNTNYWNKLNYVPSLTGYNNPEVIGNTTYYTKNEYQTGTSQSSGFSNSVQSSKNPDTNYTTYKSPLPAVADRQSCDGQGVYILSDGEPTNNVDSSILATALNKNSFSGTGGLSGGTNWNYMSNFAKALFNGGTVQSNATNATNPANVSIQTGFVGFGAALNSLNTPDAQNACKLSSRTQSDRLQDDACSPNQATNATSSPGWGNGSFSAAISPEDVTASVVKFIDAIGGIPLDPLTTGQISVPYDALNPNNLSQTGYLRAFEPDPASSKLTWKGNLKKYTVAMIGAFQGASGGLVYDDKGGFKTGTKDYWNSSGYTDGGKVFLGGAYSQVPLPYNGQTETTAADGSITRYAYTASSKLRNLFTDVSSVTGSSLTPSTGSQSGTNLLQIPEKPASAFNSVSSIATYVLGKFDPSNGQAVLKDFPTTIKLKLLNYLGYSTDITSSSLPTNLTAQDAPYLSMGGSIHSLPVQLTYSGTLDSQGNLTSTRDQSIVYGSMEGGLHIVDASSGEEQMVFVPSEILNDPTKSKALVVGQTDILSPSHGVDATWVSDPSYAISTTTSGGSTVTKVTARQMNIYGGMRMGGNSYYGLNVLSPSSPKLLFRIDKTTSGFDRLGQTWSKPVLANVRYNGKITRVMIVGGGYDQCYENPNFSLGANVSNTDFTDTSCNNKSQAQGNAVYIINAKTGALIWSATYRDNSTDGQQYMKHSIVSRISTLDRDADGLVDHLYFGDLGGQVFRADLNNKATSTSGFGVRVVRLANLATNDTNNDANNDYRGAKAPRFYVQPTVTIHDQGANTFIVVGIASGNRSTPLDVYPIKGREGMLPANALSNQPTNNVYGILDRDFIKRDLITGNPTLDTQDKERSAFKKNPQILTGTQRVVDFFFPSSGSGVAGWYRSLSSQNTSTSGINSVERADNSFRTKGGLKAFEEEPIAITNNLLVPVYDPEGTGIEPPNPCKPRVIGETDWQRYCLPYGACLNSNGTLNTNLERKSGFLTKTTNCPAGVGECNDNVLGAGIRGITFVPKPDSGATNSCGKLTMAGNTQGTGEWQCTSRLIQTRWYERYR
ncbi:pilus assembly protein PilY [Acinetobacter ursingii]